MTARTESRGQILFLALILALAVVTRFWGLGAESLWLDEATSLLVAENTPAGIVALTAEDIHPPLYYLLLHAWLVFGRSEAALRSLSAVIGVLTVAALYGWARWLWGARLATLAALLLALSPLHVWYSQETRMYGLMALWAVLSTWLMTVAWESRRPLPWIGYVLAAALGMYTHYYMGFALLAQNAFVAWLALRRRALAGQLARWALAQIAWLALFGPWMPIVVRQIGEGGGAWVAQAVGRPDWRVLWDTFIGFTIGPLREGFSAWLRRGAYVFYGLLLIGGLAQATLGRAEGVEEPAGSWSRRERGVLCLTWWALPIGTAWLASQVKPLYTLRYQLPFLPPFVVLLALGIETLARRRPAVRVALVLMAAGLSVGALALMAETPQKPDWRGTTAAIVAQAGPADVVVPEPFWNAKPLRYYAGEALAIYAGAPLPATEAGVGQAMQQATTDRGRLWLVEDVGHYGDPQRRLASYLAKHYQQIQVETVPGIGEVTLYDLDGTGP